MLRLDHNEIDSLPLSLEKCKELRGLYLSANQLKELPQEIGSLLAL